MPEWKTYRLQRVDTIVTIVEVHTCHGEGFARARAEAGSLEQITEKEDVQIINQTETTEVTALTVKDGSFVEILIPKPGPPTEVRIASPEA